MRIKKNIVEIVLNKTELENISSTYPFVDFIKVIYNLEEDKDMARCFIRLSNILIVNIDKTKDMSEQLNKELKKFLKKYNWEESKK